MGGWRSGSAFALHGILPNAAKGRGFNPLILHCFEEKVREEVKEEKEKKSPQSHFIQTVLAVFTRSFVFALH